MHNSNHNFTEMYLRVVDLTLSDGTVKCKQSLIDARIHHKQRALSPAAVTRVKQIQQDGLPGTTWMCRLHGVPRAPIGDNQIRTRSLPTALLYFTQNVNKITT